MLVVFLLDTSASMNQRCANGLSLLDCAKSAIEHFHKVRSRDAACRLDRYMLVTCDDESDCIKVVEKYPFTHFMRALKSVQARDLTNIGGALQRIFAFLHVQRLTLDIDRYGQGRNPCVNDLTTILLVTDGTELTSLAGVSQVLLSNGPLPLGADLAVQPFRWDQRVFATVLRIPSVSAAVLERSGPIPQNAPISGAQSAVVMDTNISAFCDFTGGKCFVATSWKILMQHTEVMAARLPPCVIVSFEHMSLPGSASLPPQVHQACQRKMLLVRGGQAQGQGHWPIPEAYWPDPSHSGIPPRDPHPVIAYKPMDADPYVPANFIFDKYEIESNPIMGFLLKAHAGACWQVYVRNSKGTSNGYGDPFGFLRLNRGGSNLTLFVLPYNYPVLWQLLDQLGKIPGAAKMAPLPQWRQDMERYCNSIPAYYGPPLRHALKRWGLNAHVVPDSMENSLLAGFVGTQLKKLKLEAKVIFDADMSRIMTEQQFIGISRGVHHSGRILPQLGPASTEAPPGFNTTGSFSLQPRGIGHGEQVTTRKMGWEMLLPSGPSPPHAPPPYATPVLFPPTLGMVGPEVAATSSVSTGIMKDIGLFKNPFDVPRDQLLRQLQYLPIRVALAADARHQNRRNDREGGKILNSSISNLAAHLVAKEEEEARHSLPIEKMGDFNDALLKQQPPRNPFAEEPDRSKQQRTMFGNPYRQEKSDGNADEAWLEGTSPLLRGRKRRRRLPPDSASGPALSSSSSSTSDSTIDVSSTEVTSPAKPGRDIGITDAKAPDASLPPLSDHSKPIEQRPFVLGAESAEEKFNPKHLKSGLNAERPNEPSEKFLGSTDKVEAAANDAVVTNNIETMIVEHSGRKRRIVVVTPLGSHQEQSHVVAFLLSVIKALKYSKPSNTQKLFELLSVPDFPVDKSNFLEQLILQAQRYNKVAVAKELVEYREKLITCQPVINPH
ncbi:unnamed protein product [Sphagnum compactum]